MLRFWGDKRAAPVFANAWAPSLASWSTITCACFVLGSSTRQQHVYRTGVVYLILIVLQVFSQHVVSRKQAHSPNSATNNAFLFCRRDINVAACTV